MNYAEAVDNLCSLLEQRWNGAKISREALQKAVANIRERKVCESFPSDEEIKQKFSEFEKKSHKRYWDSGCRIDHHFDAALDLAKWLMSHPQPGCQHDEVIYRAGIPQCSECGKPVDCRHPVAIVRVRKDRKFLDIDHSTTGAYDPDDWGDEEW